LWHVTLHGYQSVWASRQTYSLGAAGFATVRERIPEEDTGPGLIEELTLTILELPLTGLIPAGLILGGVLGWAGGGLEVVGKINVPAWVFAAVAAVVAALVRQMLGWHHSGSPARAPKKCRIAHGDVVFRFARRGDRSCSSTARGPGR
jgi:hypothetical protein